MNSLGGWYSIRHVAELLGLSSGQALQLCADGPLEAEASEVEPHVHRDVLVVFEAEFCR